MTHGQGSHVDRSTVGQRAIVFEWLDWPFITKREGSFNARFDDAARLEAWDIAANGAFMQPVWLGE